MDMATASLSQGLGTQVGDEALVRAGLQPAAQHVLCPADQWKQRNTSIIINYLLDRVPEFQKLAELRRKVNRKSLYET